MKIGAHFKASGNESKIRGKYENIKSAIVFAGNGIKVEYRLLYGKLQGDDIYSVLVSLYDNGTLTDEEFVFDVSRDRGDANVIFRKLCENTVTPCSVFECLEVILEEFI